MNGLAACAGIGGLELALKLALPDYRTVCFVEREAFAAATLAARMEDGALDAAPIWDDLRTFDARPWRGVVDLVTAGYPCQPFSVAGCGRGEADERHLWPHVARVVSECEPSLVFCENVPPHLSRGFDVVTRDLQGLGYVVAALLLRAEDLGAPHKRERLFFLALNVADFDGEGCALVAQRDGEAPDTGPPYWDDAHRCDPYVADASRVADYEPDAQACTSNGGWPRSRSSSVGGGDSLSDASGVDIRLEPRGSGGSNGADSRVARDAGEEWIAAFPPGPADADGWRRYLEREPGAQPAIRRSAHELSYRLDELRALGNAVVPQVAALAFGILYRELRR